MANKAEILAAISTSGSPVSPGEVAKLLHLESSAQLGPQIERLEKQGLIVRDENRNASLTDEGRAEIDRLQNLVPGSLPTEEEAGATEYQQFYNIGLTLGVDRNLSGLTARHVWNGGKYDDLEWVWKGMKEMQIRPDLATRWFNSWRSQLGQGMPPQVAAQIAGRSSSEEPEDKGEKGEKGDRKGFSYIIDNGWPVFVGEGLGDMIYGDAVRLCEVRAVRGRPPAAAEGAAAPPQTPGSLAEDMVKFLRAAQEMGGGQKGKSYVVSENEEGGVEVKEIEGNEPVVVPAKAAPVGAPVNYLLRENGEVDVLEPGRPVVIRQEAPNPPPEREKTFFLDEKGEVSELKPGQPVVIYRDRQVAGDNRPVIQMKSPDGSPFTLDLATFFHLEDHKAEMARKQESHEVKISVAKGVKDIVEKFGKAAARLEEDE